MEEPPDDRSPLRRLRDRKLAQWAVAYLAGGWVVLQVLDVTAEPWGLSPDAVRAAQVLVVAGFFVTLVLAWYHGERGRQRASLPEVAILGGLLIASGTAVALLTSRGTDGPAGPPRDRAPAMAGNPGIGPEPAVAVLPFRVQGAEMEVWREGMVDALTSYLDGVTGLRAIDARTVLARWRAVVGATEEVDLATALEVAAQVGARHALLGSGLRVGNEIRFTGSLYAVDSGSSLTQLSIEGTADGVLGLVDRFGTETVVALADAGLELVPGVDFESVTTPSPPAMRAFLEGEAAFRAGEFDAAVSALDRAVAADSTFALAVYRLGMACSWGVPRCSDIDRWVIHLVRAIELGLPERKALPARAAVAIFRDSSLGELEALQRGVVRYPDDFEILQYLGEYFWHMGQLGALPQWREESDRILRRVLELDPGFVVAYQHPVGLAFMTDDSTSAAQLIDAVGRLEPGGALHRLYRILFAATFAHPPDSAAIAAGVDALEQLARDGGTTPLGSRDEYLGHPRFAGLVREIESRVVEPGGPRGVFCIQRTLAAGEWRRLLGYATDPRVDANGRRYCLFAAYATGLPVPTAPLEAALADGTPAAEPYVDDLDTPPGLWVGAYAADHGRWDDYEAALGQLREAMQRSEANGEDARRDLYEATVTTLSAYGTWKRGDPADAVEILEALPLRYRGSIVRWWMGQLYLETDRPEDAALYFDTHYWLWWSHALLYRGQAFEQMDEQDRAAEAYTAFIEAWEGADPPLQPLVDEARRRLAALAVAGR